MGEYQNKENQFLWKIAGFKRDILEDCKVDGHHASIIATLLIIVGIYASIAWTIFFMSVVKSLIFAIPLGIFMGLFIFFLDRALISSLVKVKQTLSVQYFISAGFRVFLAILIGYILAEPVVHAIYHREIERESQILVDIKNKERKEKLEDEYNLEMNMLNERQKNLNEELQGYQNNYLNASTSFSQEMDGTGGSGNVGYKSIAKKKEDILNFEKNNYLRQQEVLQPKIDSVSQRITFLENQINTEYERFKKNTTEFGPLIKTEALQSLKDKDSTNILKYKHWLLLAILALIELSAFIVKFIYATSSYSKKVEDINLEEKNRHSTNKDLSLEKQSIFKEKATENEGKLLMDFFKETQLVNKDRIKQLMQDWRDKKYSLDELWRKFKEEYSQNRY